MAEKVIHSQLSKFMEETNQLSHNLHGYRMKHSTSTVMLQISDSILQAVDLNTIATLVTIDESAAFDCVNADILNKKLQLYNIDKKTRDWLTDYMVDREMFVEIGTKRSNTISVSRGVPQGSVLGPLLFTIYTNELPEVMIDKDCQKPAHRETETLFPSNCQECGTIPSFTDDSTYVMKTKTRAQSQEKVTQVTEKMKTYLNSQDLVVNISKTSMLENMVKQKRSKLKGTQPEILTVNNKGEDKIIRPARYIHLLGVNWEQNLTWNSHISTGEKALLPSIRQLLGSLKYISGQVPIKSKIILANSLIMSKLVYGIALWGGTYEFNVKKLQAVVNKTARWASNSSRRTKTTVLMERCGWLTVRELIKYHTVLTLWKVLWFRIPLQLHKRVNLDADFIVHMQEPRLQTCKLGFLWRATSNWNSLSLETRSMKSTFVFSGESMECHRRENKGRFRRTHYPRLNRNSSAHLDELTLKGLLSILIKSQTRPIKANSAT